MRRGVRGCGVCGAVLFMLVLCADAAVPEGFTYQGVARDSSNNVVASRTISLKLSILTGNAAGDAVYVETQSAATNQYGLFTTNVGAGTVVSGTFSAIDWGGGGHYLKVEADFAGGADYLTMGAAQLMSVPCALAAKKASTADTAASALTAAALAVGSDDKARLDGAIQKGSNLADLTSVAAARGNLGLGSVENTALSTWSGSASITTLGTVTTGTWNAGAVTAAGDIQSGGKYKIGSTQALAMPLTGNLIAGNGGGLLSNAGGGDNGCHNTFLGLNAGSTGTTGYSNTAVGADALKANTTGCKNTAVGQYALCAQSYDYPSAWSSCNTAVGYQSLYSNQPTSTSNGVYNTAVGAFSLSTNTTGANNTAMGTSALAANTTGSPNPAIGAAALKTNTTGVGNTALGYQAGGSATGSGNVFLGNKAGYGETGSDKLHIANSDSKTLIYGDFGSNCVVINGSSPSGSNTLTVTGSAIASAWNLSSDARLKKNIATIPDALQKVLNLRGVNFEWIDTANREEGIRMGFVAQEVAEVAPEVVDSKGEYLSMQYGPLTALLVEGMKEQQKQIDALKAENQSLKEDLRKIKEALGI